MAKTARSKTRYKRTESSSSNKTADQIRAEELGIDYQLWKPGVYSFKCPDATCHFDAVELEHVLAHIQKVHTLQQQRSSSIIHVDKWGNEQPGPAGSGGSR